jgi:uncharacterized membrane protein
MDAKRALVATLLGGIALYATGYLIFDLAFTNFYRTNVGSATGVNRGSQIVWAMALPNLAYAALIMFVIGNRMSALSIGGGARIGAIVGFLLWCTVDFYFYGAMNIANLTRTMVDPLLEFVHGGIGGAVIAAALGRISPAGRRGA